MDLPSGFTVDIPALNKTDYNFTETFNISGTPTTFDVGIKTNTSVTKKMNLTLHCGELAIGLYGMNVLKPTQIDLTGAFVCDEEEGLIGMNSTSKKWNKLVDDLHLGGANDYVELTHPTEYTPENILSWTDDSGANGESVNDYVNCSAGETVETTSCKVPVSMGFSAYQITTPSSEDPDGSSSGSSSGGSSGGGGSIVVSPELEEEVVVESVPGEVELVETEELDEEPVVDIEKVTGEIEKRSNLFGNAIGLFKGGNSLVYVGLFLAFFALVAIITVVIIKTRKPKAAIIKRK